MVPSETCPILGARRRSMGRFCVGILLGKHRLRLADDGVVVDRPHPPPGCTSSDAATAPTSFSRLNCLSLASPSR